MWVLQTSIKLSTGDVDNFTVPVDTWWTTSARLCLTWVQNERVYCQIAVTRHCEIIRVQRTQISLIFELQNRRNHTCPSKRAIVAQFTLVVDKNSRNIQKSRGLRFIDSPHKSWPSSIAQTSAKCVSGIGCWKLRGTVCLEYLRVGNCLSYSKRRVTEESRHDYRIHRYRHDM